MLFSGKIEEYEAAFNLVDTEKKGSDNSSTWTQGPSRVWGLCAI